VRNCIPLMLTVVVADVVTLTAVGMH